MQTQISPDTTTELLNDSVVLIIQRDEQIVITMKEAAKLRIALEAFERRVSE